MPKPLQKKNQGRRLEKLERWKNERERIWKDGARRRRQFATIKRSGVARRER
jgi:hypothetical protein